MDVTENVLNLLDYGGLGLAMAIVVMVGWVGVKSISSAIEYLERREKEVMAQQSAREDRTIAVVDRNAQFLEQLVADGRAERDAMLALVQNISSSTVDAIDKNTEALAALCDKVDEMSHEIKNSG